jgi:hypothetical protein
MAFRFYPGYRMASYRRRFIQDFDLRGTVTTALDQWNDAAGGTIIAHGNSLTPTNPSREGGRGPSRNKVLRELGITTERIPYYPRRYRRRPRDHDTLNGFSTNTIRVRSIHAAQTLDIVKVLSKVFGFSTSPSSSDTAPIRHMFGKTSVVVQLNPLPSDEEAQPRFVAVYQFGSVVFFNMSPSETKQLLNEIKALGLVIIDCSFLIRFFIR